MAKRTKRNWDSSFQQYMEFIVKHPNYKGMPEPFKEDGSIRWIVAGKSPIGQAREKWWDNQRSLLKIEKKPGWKALVARKIHPLGEKPCQVCGKVMKLNYTYPNKTCPYKKSTNEECDKEQCDLFQQQHACPHLGPGVMSDCPDRFDGFHTYNRCCRSVQDTGRHSDNLSRYGEDRRAYEFWSEGDWKAASWLMQEFRKNGISPDHIGPISLGFCHRPRFSPMTRGQNSAKGNRLTLDDVKSLIEDERRGDQIVSSHTKPLWDKLKNLVQTDEDAKMISNLMRSNLHKIMTTFSMIAENGHKEFLIKFFLHPEYALFQHEFVDFCPSTGAFSKILTTKATRTEHRRNAERYIRKSFEALELYKTKDNRHAFFAMNQATREIFDKIMECLSLKDFEKGRILLDRIFGLFAEEALKTFHTRRN
jgi:hypothetical protein